MNLRERLLRGVPPDSRDIDIGPTISVGDARKILALLEAARRFHGRATGTMVWSQGDDEDSFYAAKDDLLNAIADMETHL